MHPKFRWTMLAASIAALPAFAGPEGAVVRSGEAKIYQYGPRTDVNQSTDRAVIDWRSFNVGRDELVRFAVPSARSSTLNRVTGDQASTILGSIQSNGQVVLVNPNGILIGSEARVDVGSLIATTANIRDQDFMAASLKFAEPGKPGASIVNQGTIRATAGDAGLVALVAPSVRNDGVIQARLGKVVMASGDTFALDLYGDSLVSLALSDANVGALTDVTGRTVKALIEQSATGAIDAAGGKIMLITAGAARAVVDNVIKMGGIAVADSVGTKNGEIVIAGRGGNVEVGGAIAARGGTAGTTGGVVEILGERVLLTAPAIVDASGVAGGGQIAIGRELSGGASIGGTLRADAVTVSPGTSLKVGAIDRGDGGTLSIWSERSTSVGGVADARGGQVAGKGGAIEVGSAGDLEFSGVADASAAGVRGALRLSADSLVVGASSAAGISRTLRTGTDVQIDAAHDVVINASIDGRGGSRNGAGLDVRARGRVEFTEDLFTADGRVSIMAQNGSVLANDRRVATGSDRRSDPLIATGSGTISLTGTGLRLFRLYTAGDVILTATGGEIALNANLGEAPTGIGGTAGEVSVGPLGSLQINHKAAIGGQEIAMAGATVAQGGSINIDSNDNIRIFGKVTIGDVSIFADPKRFAPRVTIHSKKFDPPCAPGATCETQNLLLNTKYQTALGRAKRYDELKVPGTDPTKLENYNSSTPESGLTPPGDLHSIPAAGSFADVSSGRFIPDIVIDRGPGTADQSLGSVQARLVDYKIERGSEDDEGMTTGGRGTAQQADLGRSQSETAARDVFADNVHVARGPICERAGTAPGYFGTNTFGVALPKGC